MWEKLKIIYGSDDHFMKTKDEILRGNLDDMRMQEGEDIEVYDK